MNRLTGEILVLGLGNILMSDDGLGVRAAQALKEKSIPPGVLVVEAGTSALRHLDAISRSPILLILDAVRAGGPAGSLYRLTWQDLLPSPGGWRDAHGFSLPALVELARSLDGLPAQVLILGLEPWQTGPGTRLSPPVQAALPRLVEAAGQEIACRLLRP